MIVSSGTDFLCFFYVLIWSLELLIRKLNDYIRCSILKKFKFEKFKSETTTLIFKFVLQMNAIIMFFF